MENQNINKYYYIIEGGKPAELFDILLVERLRLRKEAKNLAKEVKAEDTFSDFNPFRTSGTSGVVGFSFKKGEAPKGWVKAPRCEVLPGFVSVRPSRRSKAGKELLRRMSEIQPQTDNRELYALFGYTDMVFGNDLSLYFTTAGTLGSYRVVAIPSNGEPVEVEVEGARRIEEWEFRKLQHEAEEAQKTKVTT